MDCLKRKSKDKDAEKSKNKDADKTKKKKPSAGLVLDMIGEIKIGESFELFKAWGKVRDQHALVFFDPSAKVNFISPDLATKLGVRLEKMGSLQEASMAAPGSAVPITPIIGKLRCTYRIMLIRKSSTLCHWMAVMFCWACLGSTVLRHQLSFSRRR